MTKEQREKLNNAPRIHLNTNLQGLSTSATIAIQQLSRTLTGEGREIYRLGLGQSPFPVPDSVVEALKENAHQKDYLAVKGLEELRLSLIDHHKRTFDIDCGMEDIIVGPGSKELMFILQLVYDGEILIPMPSWVSYYPQAKIIGRHVNTIMTTRENSWKITAEQIDGICRLDPGRSRLLILNYPSNPTGQTYSVEELKELAEVLSKYQVLVLSDEIYAKLTFSGEHTSIVNFYPKGTIFSGGLSKWCGAGGWRLGLFVVPENLRWLTDAMATVASETFTSTSAPIQYAAVAAFQQNPEIDVYVEKCREILAALSKSIMAKFQKTRANVLAPQGGFYIFPDFDQYRQLFLKKGIQTSTDLCDKLLQDTGVAILPGVEFGRPKDELTVRIAFVDFNGTAALENFPANAVLNDKYLQNYCGRTLMAVDKIVDWLAE